VLANVSIIVAPEQGCQKHSCAESGSRLSGSRHFFEHGKKIKKKKKKA
jgi:hypothetical protein